MSTIVGFYAIYVGVRSQYNSSTSVRESRREKTSLAGEFTTGIYKFYEMFQSKSNWIAITACMKKILRLKKMDLDAEPGP